MELPVAQLWTGEARNFKHLAFVVTLWNLLSIISCQNVSSADQINNFTDVDFQGNTTRDTNIANFRLHAALSGNLSLFDVVNTSKSRTLVPVGVTMKPTHIPAVRMSQSKWNIHSNSHTGTNTNSNIVPAAGLPVPMPVFNERKPVNISNTSTARTKSDSESGNTFSFLADGKQGTAGIYIPMHKLLRRRRQTGRQQLRRRGHSPRTDQRVLMLLNPGSRGHQNRSAQVMLLTPQHNNPLYNLTTANSTIGQVRVARVGNITRGRQDRNDRELQSKPAIQNLSDLNLVDLTFPLIAQNNKVTLVQNNSTDTRNVNRALQDTRRRNNATAIRQASGIRPTQRIREKSRATNTFQVTRVPPRPNARIINLRLQNRAHTPSPITGQSRRTRPAINRHVTRRPATRLTFVQPVSGRRISSSQRRGTIPGVSRARPARPAIRTRASTGSRSQTRRRPSSRTRAVSRRANTARRTVPRRTRRIQPARPRAPPDPFTQRFSAGFQRGSALLHQPPMDITSFDGPRPEGALSRTQQAPGFINSIALQNNIPFPGIGPGLFGGGPGVFFGGGFL